MCFPAPVGPVFYPVTHGVCIMAEEFIRTIITIRVAVTPLLGADNASISALPPLPIWAVQFI